MASHIYYRVGRYADSIHGNEAAAAADEAFLAEVNDTGIYGGAYYPHNVHFVMVSAQMAGDAEKTIAMADKLGEVVTDDAAATIGWVQPIMLAPFWAHAQYSAPDDILALADPGDRFPFVKAMWHYARGVAYAEKGDVAAATAEAEAIDAIANTADLSFLINNYIPAEPVLQVARHVVLGRIANAKGYAGTAVDEFQRAVAIQDTLPYTEPPFWYYPVRQSLGAALLNAGRVEEAIAVFEAANKESPNNGWVIFGLMEAQKKAGDTEGAAMSEAALDKAWIGPPELLDLSRL
jgi:tetratricopeptide (TPR) repeat protein